MLHVITGLGVGGAETMLTRLITRAAPGALDQRVVSLLPGGATRTTLEHAGVQVGDLGMRRALPSVSALWRLAGIIREWRPDVVQGWMYHADLTALAALCLSGRRAATSLAWGIRCSDMDTGRYSWRLRAVISACSALSSRVDVVVANSVAGRTVHAGLGYRPRRFEVIPNGIDVDRLVPDDDARSRFRAVLGLAPQDVVVAHVARVDPMKDHAGFLAALEQVPGVRTLLIGTGTENLPERPGVMRLGCRSDVPQLLNAADIVVSSSAFGEGFSNALAEGMASGCIPVATDVGDAGLIVGDCGVIVPPRTPTALAAALSGIAALPPDERARRGAAARRRIVENFSLDRVIGRFSALYREMCVSCAA